MTYGVVICPRCEQVKAAEARLIGEAEEDRKILTALFSSPFVRSREQKGALSPEYP